MSALPSGLPQRPFKPARTALRLWCVVALVLFAELMLAWPGGWTNDGRLQYEEALSGRYTDWHPPIVAATWHRLMAVMGEGPAAMLLLQLGLHWLGFGLIAHGLAMRGRGRAAWLAVAAGLFPIFPYYGSALYKDVPLASAWIAAVGLVWWSQARWPQRARLPWGIALACGLLLAWGTLARANAVFGVGALAVLVYAAAPAAVSMRRLLPMAVVGALVALPVSSLINAKVFEARPTGAIRSLQVFDIAGIARFSGDGAVLPEGSGMTMDNVRRCYTPYWWDAYSPWGRCSEVSAALEFGPQHPSISERSLTGPWLKAIAAHPAAYLAHRAAHFNSELYLAVPVRHAKLAPFDEDLDPSTVLPRPMGERLKELVVRNPLLWPAAWLAAAIGLLVLLTSREAARGVGAAPAAALAVSALGYSAGYALVGVATDLRYHYWSVMAVLVALLLGWPALRRAAADRARLRRALLPLALVLVVGVTTRLAEITTFVLF